MGAGQSTTPSPTATEAGAPEATAASAAPPPTSQSNYRVLYRVDSRDSTSTDRDVLLAQRPPLRRRMWLPSRPKRSVRACHVAYCVCVCVCAPRLTSECPLACSSTRDSRLNAPDSQPSRSTEALSSVSSSSYREQHGRLAAVSQGLADARAVGLQASRRLDCLCRPTVLALGPQSCMYHWFMAFFDLNGCIDAID